MDLDSDSFFFLPGEIVGKVEEIKTKYSLKKIKIGPGLVLKDDTILATTCGFLTASKSIIWLYLPSQNDYVIGKVVKTRGDHYKVDLGSHVISKLPVLAFKNATKKVRPQLNIGDLVYAKVLSADSNIDYELTCDGSDSIGEALGPLSSFNSYLITISLALAYRFKIIPETRLLTKNSPLTETLISNVPENCDIIVGVNGFIFISASEADVAIKLAQAFYHLNKNPVVAQSIEL